MRLKTLSAGFFIPLLLLVQLSFSQSAPYSDQDCLSCHGKPETAQIMADGTVRSLFVDPEQWNQDAHHTGKILCVDCHRHANPYIHFREGFIKVDCSRCHPEEAEEYQKNIHTTFAAPSAGKELPLCYHCHTKHHVLRHDDPESSVSENHIGDTCGTCHAEVMLKGIFKGSSLGKISGHRKGDISERFDMRVCINCHYADSAHGAKRVYKDFCSRCHDVRSLASTIMGPTHLNSQRAASLNDLSSALVLSFVLGFCLFFGYRSRGRLVEGVKSRVKGITIPKEDKPSEDTGEAKDTEGADSDRQPEQPPKKTGEEENEPPLESAEEKASEEGSSHKEQPEKTEPHTGGEQELDAQGDKKEDQSIEGETAEEEQAASRDKDESLSPHTPDHEDKPDDGEKETQ